MQPAQVQIDSRAAVTTIEAEPGLFPLNVGRAAVLVIDMQNDFGEKGGMFDRAGIDISAIQAAVVPTAKVLAAARGNGIPVVYLKMAFKADLSDAGPAGSPNHDRHRFMKAGEEVFDPNGKPSRILVRDTWNTAILDALAPEPGDLVIYKHRFSGFFETELHSLLTARGIRDLIVVGCTTSICVESTIRDAMFRDYSCLLLRDCTAEPIGDAPGRSNHEASLLSIRMLLGWVSSSDVFLRDLE